MCENMSGRFQKAMKAISLSEPEVNLCESDIKKLSAFFEILIDIDKRQKHMQEQVQSKKH